MGRPVTRLPPGRLTCLLLVLLLVPLAPAVNAEPLRVLSQNMDQLFDNVDDGNNERIVSRNRFQKRVKSAAKKFGKHFGLPHIIALQEVENLYVLRQIAAEIEDRYHVNYRPILRPGQDTSGINLGYLVREDVKIRKVDQLFTDRVFKMTGKPLFTRPPLYLEACYLENCLSLVNVHLRSMRGIGSASRGERVRHKRLGQAETIAAWSNRFQQSRDGESLLLLGDFNALNPSDRHVDVVGIISGNPDNKTARLSAPDLVEPDLVDLTRLIPSARRYSFIYRQQKQQLDYMFINRDFAANVESIVFSRIDYHFSDHAGLLAWFRW